MLKLSLNRFPGSHSRLSATSRSHFSALFRRQHGMSALTFQTELRMSRARELLDTTDLSIASIAHRVGYEDAYYFSRQFGKVQGVAPTAYRRRSL